MAFGRVFAHFLASFSWRGIDVQRIVHRFHRVSADAFGWPDVLRGFLHTRRQWTHSAVAGSRAPRPAKVAETTPRLGPGREWEMVTDVIARQLSRAPEIAAIQAHAALKIDAAEHAYDRIVADFAKLLATPAAPTLRPAGRLTHRPDQEMRRPLAA